MSDANQDVVVKFRLEHGLCHMCGTQIYEMDWSDHGHLRRLVPLTEPGCVKGGRCLFCYPDPVTAEDPVPNPAEDPAADPAADPAPNPAEDPAPSQQEVARAVSTGDEHSDRTQETRADSSNADSTQQTARVARSPENRAMLPHRRQARPNASEFETGNRTKKQRITCLNDSSPGSADDSSWSGSSTDTENNELTSSQPPDGDLVISVRDHHGEEFRGQVTEGTAKKGKGTFRNVNDSSSYYEGDFLNGLMEGEGTQKDTAECVYTGSFKRGAAHGHGRCTWPSGWVYEGEWVKDLREGKGACRQDRDGGEMYSREWKADKWHGKGELTFAGGDKYIGDFKEDKMHGHGVYEFSNGSRYQGYFEHGHRSGLGEIVYEDGTRYVGEWKNNWRDGQGTQYETDGTVFQGTFRADERCDGSLRMQDGFLRPVKDGKLSD